MWLLNCKKLFVCCLTMKKNKQTRKLVSFLLPSPLPAGLQGGRVFFNAVKEGDLVMFASDDEQDRVLWVQAMYRATGQSYKPVPPPQNKTTNCRGASQKPASPISRFCSYCTSFFFIYGQTQTPAGGWIDAAAKQDEGTANTPPAVPVCPLQFQMW